MIGRDGLIKTNLAILVENSEAIPRHKNGGEARPTVRTRCISRCTGIRIESDELVGAAVRILQVMRRKLSHRQDVGILQRR